VNTNVSMTDDVDDDFDSNILCRVQLTFPILLIMLKMSF